MTIEMSTCYNFTYLLSFFSFNRHVEMWTMQMEARQLTTEAGSWSLCTRIEEKTGEEL